MEKPKLGQIEALTRDNFEAVSKRLGRLIWNGEYDEALPLADKILEFRSGQGERNAALVQYASNYYSAASRLWKEKGARKIADVGKYMNTALRALQERLQREMEIGGGKKNGMIPVSLNRMTSSELDIMQAVYRSAAEMTDKIPLVKPLRELLLAKEKDPVRDFDAAALLAIRAGLKRVREEQSAGKKVPPHTEIFLRAGAFDIARRYGWKKTSATRATRIFRIAENYPWPPEEVSSEDVSEKMSEYGQASRVARHLRDIARASQDAARAQEYEKKAKSYAASIPDQKAKL